MRFAVHEREPTTQQRGPRRLNFAYFVCLFNNRNVYTCTIFNTETTIILVYYFSVYNSMVYYVNGIVHASKMAGRRRQILQLEGGIGRSDCGGEFVSARQCVCACVFYIVSAKTPPHEVISGVSLSTRTRVCICTYVHVLLRCSYTLVSRDI